MPTAWQPNGVITAACHLKTHNHFKFRSEESAMRIFFITIFAYIFIHTILFIGMNDVRLTTTKRAFAYGKGSVAVVIPAQLGFKPGDKIKVTFESIQEVSE